MRPLMATSSGEELIPALQTKSRLLLSIISEDNGKARQAALFDPALINVFAVMLVHKVAKILCGPAKVINIAKRKLVKGLLKDIENQYKPALKNIHKDILLHFVINKIFQMNLRRPNEVT